ncbi:nad kinase domain-containing protein 1-like [Stylonychia lemnae]|uniref:Nad kinase domain-containing protein 1-like n=1 Tax=Stylonychia lemnae TaxID=5949 RepID=A0A077ZQL3_STYLE|nr:nad kinase domain-containing protein 1-like [Stylonychia lemnae]|eukprot:CDW71739.1 nad kinase domain-containing protein 1-like [Stylonychia lemnae]
MDIIRDNDLAQKDFQDRDLIVSIGKNHNEANGLILDTSRDNEALCNISIPVDQCEAAVAKMMTNLEANKFQQFLRNRALFSVVKTKAKPQNVEKLILNEVAYVDGRDMGQFKSSGIIISTGTGSSGWLFSARKINPEDIRAVQLLYGCEEVSESVNRNLASLINSTYVFPYDSDQLYYYVREGYVRHDNSFSWRSEGFCKEIKIVNEIIEGRILIDGYYNYSLEIGEQFKIKTAPDRSLRCLRFL